MRLAVLLSLGASQEHGAANLPEPSLPGNPVGLHYRRLQPKSNHPPSHDQRLSSIKNRKIAISRHESANSGYRLGGTLGDSRKHWFRDKFGNGRFRLFFRYDLRAKIIVYVWVNDETTLRTYGAKSDAYAVFTSMLNDGNPPDGWDRLLAACKDPEALKRAENMLKKADED